MRVLTVEDDKRVGENRRLIRTMWKVDRDENFPKGIEFAVHEL